MKRLRRRTIVLIFCIIILGMLVTWGVSRKATPPQVPVAKAARERIVSTISTNGKVEPIVWGTARAERPGVVQKIYVHRGQEVRAGESLVTLDTRQLSADLAGATAKVQQAEAEQQVVNQGGRSVDTTEIDTSLSKVRLDLATAQRDLDTLRRLEARHAATRKEVQDAQEHVNQLQLQIQSLDKRRAALVTQPDRAAAEARVREAQAAETAARSNVAMAVVRAPIAGTVYQFDLQPGSFLQAGDLVANVGRLDRVRVRVYVDEPDLGRVGVGMPVTISWDAMPGRHWTGSVDRLPTQIVPLGTRQVGEVGCVIENPDRDLLPGTNVDVEIQSRVVDNALTVPREALRREANSSGVLMLSSENTLMWRPIQTGITSAGRVQVLSGLKDGDAVALPTDRVLKPGMKITPEFP